MSRISKDYQVMGMSRDAFYRDKSTVGEGSVEAFSPGARPIWTIASIV